jgi:hypothetical protein
MILRHERMNLSLARPYYNICVVYYLVSKLTFGARARAQKHTSCRHGTLSLHTRLLKYSTTTAGGGSL